ncbi:hypothetical protein [Haloferula sp. A504]|uniref:hypothetical protein n=1 Tax=Haloferula sp. A504 TaxID=3373601 RepID=UPI0031C51070|nr:hypothetical protein [Verrucomicrobiaceae bacterium E54]
MFALLSLVPVAGMASVADFDPFAPPEPPKMVRVQVEFVEVAHADYTEWMMGNRSASDATALRMKLAGLVEQNQAKVVETMMVVVQSGKKASSGSNCEFIWPLVYEPPRLPTPGHFPLPPDDIRRIRLGIPLTPTAFETRNLGSNLEIVPTVAKDGRTISLELAPELGFLAGHVAYRDFITPDQHRFQQRHPIFITQRVNVELTCRSGSYALVTVLTPSDEDGQLDPSRKTMVFVRCDVVEVKEVSP